MQGKKSGLHHAELQRTRIKKDGEAVSAVVHLIEGWVNPFAEKQDLISISTARTAPRDIASDLMKAHEIGEQCYSYFKEERLEKDPPTKQFHDPIPANKLKTFSNLCKKKEVKSSGRVIIWSHHSDGTRAHSQDGRHPVASPRTFNLGSVHT